MGNQGHTPGPWEAEYSDYGEEIWYGGEGAGVWSIKGPKECYLAGMGDESADEQERAAANARLIAAAPDLLEACERLRDHGSIADEWGSGQSTELARILDAMDAAIAKARGDA